MRSSVIQGRVAAGPDLFCLRGLPSNRQFLGGEYALNKTFFLSISTTNSFSLSHSLQLLVGANLRERVCGVQDQVRLKGFCQMFGGTNVQLIIKVQKSHKLLEETERIAHFPQMFFLRLLSQWGILYSVFNNFHF